MQDSPVCTPELLRRLHRWAAAPTQTPQLRAHGRHEGRRPPNVRDHGERGRRRCADRGERGRRHRRADRGRDGGGRCRRGGSVSWRHCYGARRTTRGSRGPTGSQRDRDRRCKGRLEGRRRSSSTRPGWAEEAGGGKEGG
jgi:hypothetical protein